MAVHEFQVERAAREELIHTEQVARESILIKTTAKGIAERLRKSWGAGWDNISEEQKKDAIARRLLMEILNFSEGTVSVSVAQRIWLAVQKEMGIPL